MAGKNYRQLAELEFATRQFSDDLWLAAEAFLQGHDFRAAADGFEKYLQHELKKRRPGALAGLAEARLALNDLAGTLAACQECIEFYPNDAACYRARLLAAEANLEKGDFTTAEDLLRQSLTDDRLTPESREWRDSLFTLGKTLYADGRYEEAILRLQEAIDRYPNTPQAIEARYLVAQSYLAAAKAPQEKLEKDTIESARIAHQRQKRQYLTGAIANFSAVQNVLNQRQEQHELTPLEKAILRNSYFAMGARSSISANMKTPCKRIPRPRIAINTIPRCSKPSCKWPIAIGGSIGRSKPAAPCNRPRWCSIDCRPTPHIRTAPTTPAANGPNYSIGSMDFKSLDHVTRAELRPRTNQNA